jgi:small redox-active disulfide protein 2
MKNKNITIKILGSGCPPCQLLEFRAKKAVEELGLKDVQVEHIYEIDKIIEYGVMSTPAIVIDEEVKAAGRIPDIEEIKKWLK